MSPQTSPLANPVWGATELASICGKLEEIRGGEGVDVVSGKKEFAMEMPKAPRLSAVPRPSQAIAPAPRKVDIASDLRTRGCAVCDQRGLRHEYNVPGEGTPLVVFSENPARTPEEKRYPATGIVLGLTAVRERWTRRFDYPTNPKKFIIKLGAAASTVATISIQFLPVNGSNPTTEAATKVRFVSF